MARSSGDALHVLVSVVLPPLSVYRDMGFGRLFWYNVGLTLLGYVPGVIHAIWLRFGR